MFKILVEGKLILQSCDYDYELTNTRIEPAKIITEKYLNFEVVCLILGESEDL